MTSMPIFQAKQRRFAARFWEASGLPAPSFGVVRAAVINQLFVCNAGCSNSAGKPDALQNLAANRVLS